ncbi:LuxR C-terminal-related transcriptional regulator [Georgenia halophila]|uniref:LuxR C-terminal-related transcriptional regulator n=1 Tax=Georgenia halophila TaxID=620889 RepID=A0ABP8KVL1_9MICO
MGATSIDLEPLAAGRAALARADWAEARARFEEAVAAGQAPEAWEGLGRAAWWQGDQEATFSARRRAYRAYRGVEDVRGAARMAMWIASDHLDFRGDDAVASAWVRRGRALVDDVGPCSETGYLLLIEADLALARSDPRTAERRSREALQVAHEIGDIGVEVVALATLGWALVASGTSENGFERLDESAALAVGEEFLETASPGWALCHTVSACAEAGDFRRAEQWCRVLHAWSTTWRSRHFFGVCRTAYGDVLATGGQWLPAEQELRTAMADVRAMRPALAAPTAVRLGRLRVRQGDVDEARVLFEAALPLPQAILALGELELARGDAMAALEAADRVLRRLGAASVLDRFPALELLARARAAAGDHEAANAAAERLERDAELVSTPYMRGRSRMVRAQVSLAATEHDDARRAAEDAIDLFGECAAPYETAEARLVLASTFANLGRHEQADGQERAAREAFALLGASPNAGRRAAHDELSLREVEILRLVAHGRSDAQIAERLFLSTHTVHRHIANIRTKLGVSSRAAAVGQAARHGLL